MARLAISKDYFPAYAALPRKAQRKADEFLRKFEQDSTAAAIHLEPLKRVLDPQLRSARIGDDYRVILRAPEHGDVFLVLWADHHDEAYRWASTKQTAVHPATGSLQIFDVNAAVAAITTPHETDELPSGVPSARASGPLLPSDLYASHSDDELFLAGVPRALLPSVRALTSDVDLDRLLPHLPPEAGEVLTALAAGIPLDEALEEVLGRVPAPAATSAPTPVDVTDVHAALARDTTQRQFLLLHEGMDLDAALKHPLDVWRVFLHPRQRKLVRATTKGPTRVLGGAGTGKTVVALHRAAFLVREVFTKPDDRVLFTTFTVNLAQDLRSQLAKLLEPDELARVEVVNIDSWASTYLRGRGVSVRPAFEKEQREHFDAAYEVYGLEDIPLDFCFAEWREVIQDQGIRSEDDYARAVRSSRGSPLGRADRRRLWPLFAAYRENLEHAGLMESLDIVRRARAELESTSATPRYRSIVVDEAQDFSAEALKLLRAIAGPEHADDIFLVGDAHQRIYGKPVALSKCGIQVRGRRSQTLRLNYRTTAAICRWSLGILRDVAVDDLDEGTADRRGYVSLREGPAPIVVREASRRAEESAVVETVKACLEAGAQPEAICIVARTHGPLRDRFLPALERANILGVILEQEEPRLPGVRLATMHRVKGLEFAVVLLVGVEKGDVPYPSPELTSQDQVISAGALLRERSLLYVAASRARDALYVFHSGEPSIFLEGVAKTSSRAKPASQPDDRSTAVAPPQADAAPSPAKEHAGERPTDRTSTLLDSLLDLPQRILTYAERRGMTTLEELASLSPSELLSERNLGRKTIQETRVVIERVTGRAWEDPAQQPVGDGRHASPWDELRTSLSEHDRALELSSLSLPARVRTYCRREALTTVGDLALKSHAALLAAPNMGRGTLADLPGALSRAIREYGHIQASTSTPQPSPESEGLLEDFKGALEGLEPMVRIIATRRSGLAGEVPTLAELGEMFGVSRERIRQLESRGCERLRKQWWASSARERILDAAKDGAIPLDALASDPWWEAAVRNPEVTKFLVEETLEIGLFVADLDGVPWLAPQKAHAVEAALADLLERAQAVALPAPLSIFEPLVTAAAMGFGPRLERRFREALLERLKVENEESGQVRVLAFGDTRDSAILALLRASPRPLHRDEIQSALGGTRLNRFPDSAILFGHGEVGLRQHFPDFERWQERLVPATVKVIERLDPNRQWQCGELLDELREEHEIPDWLTAYGLAALVRADSRLRYLGRLRVALLGSANNESRVLVHEQLETLLREAGEPVRKVELVEKLTKRLGASEAALVQVFTRPQFVRLDAERIGLLERDVPGGSAAIAEAALHAEAVLARRGRGLSELHMHDEVRGLSQAHSTWASPLTMSVLRSDGRFRFSTSGAVGLASWESTRVPTRLELAKAALDEAGGRVSIDAILARIEAHYGEAPGRSSIGSMAMHLGASVDGDDVVRR